ncbi:MAG: hypothetical protein ACK5NF_05325 [Bacilli bacterium]
MKKQLLAGTIIVAVVAVLTTVFLATRPSMNNSYAIKSKGYTYDIDGSAQSFSSKARYSLDSIYNSPKLVDDKDSFLLNDGRILFLESGETELLSNSVLFVSKNEIYDLKSKSTIELDNDKYNIGNKVKDNTNIIDSASKGSIVKLNQGQYLILDETVLENGYDYSKSYDDSALYVSIDENKKIRVFSDGKYDETISDDMYITLKSSGAKFMLAEEKLVLSKDEEVSLNNIKVNFDDDIDKSLLKDNIKEQEENKDNEENKDESKKDDSKGTGGSDVELASLLEIEYSIPLVDVNAHSDGNTIKGELLVTDVDKRLKGLTVTVKDDKQKVVEKQEYDLSKESGTFNFSSLKYQTDYYLSVEGVYLGKKEVNAVFYRKHFNLDKVNLSAKLLDTTSDSISIEFEKGWKDLNDLVIGYKKNDGTDGLIKEKVVNIGQLDTNPIVVIDDIESNSSYYIDYAKIVTKDNQNVDSSWYLIANTKKDLPTIGRVEVSYQDDKQLFKLNLDNIVDKDESISSIEYNAYLKSEYDVNGTLATSYLSVQVDGNRINQSVQAFRNSNMKNGDYIFVAKATGEISNEQFTIYSKASDVFELMYDTVEPEFEFKLEKAGSSYLEIKHIITDADETIEFSKDTNPTLTLYKLDSEGKYEENSQEIEIENRADLVDTKLFDKLTANSEYKLVFKSMIDLEDGEGLRSYEVASDVFMTTDVPKLNATFKEEIVKSDGAIFKINVDDVNNDLKGVKIKLANNTDASVEFIELDSKEIAMLPNGGYTLELKDLVANNEYDIELVDGVDSGNNAINISGKATFKTLFEKDVPTVEFFDYGSTYKSITLDYKITDIDEAMIIAQGDYPIFSIYEVDSNQEIVGEAVDSVALTQNNANLKSRVEFDGLSAETDYIVVLNASYDINKMSGIAYQQEIGKSDTLSTTSLSPIEAKLTDNEITVNSIDYNIEILSDISEVVSGQVSLYLKGNPNAISTIDLTKDLSKLALSGGKDYKFEKLTNDAEYVIKLEQFKSETNEYQINGGVLEFKTRSAFEKPEAELIWDKQASGESEIVVDYDITDKDEVLKMDSELFLPRATIYYVNQDGSLGDFITSKAIRSRADLTGTFTFDNLKSGRDYKVLVTGTYDLADGNGEKQNVLIGESETMFTRNSVVVKTIFTKTDVTSNSVNFTVTVLDNHSALKDGSAKLQVYKVADNDLVGNGIILTSQEVFELTMGASAKFKYEGLEENTAYVVKFSEIKNNSGIDLTVNENLMFETLKAKEKPSVIFSDPNVASTKMSLTADLYDPDETAVITSTLNATLVLQKLDEGKYVDVDNSTMVIKNKADFKDLQINYNKLTANNNYRIIAKSYYTLSTSSEMVNEVIGEYNFTTTQVDPVEAVVLVDQKNTTTSQVKANIKFLENSNVLTTGKMQLINAKTGALIGDVQDFNHSDFEQLLSADGKDFVFSMETLGVELNSNTEYKIKFIDVLDDGSNVIEVNVSNNALKTRKQIPLANTVHLDLDKDKIMSAIIGNKDDLPYSDLDSSIDSITYDIYNSNDLSKSLKTLVVESKDNFDKNVLFDINQKELGRGYSYVVVSKITYNDNYEITRMKVSSDIKVVKKDIPKVKYEFVSRTKDGLKMNINVIDNDNSIVDGTLKLKTGSSETNLQVGKNSITIGGSITSLSTIAKVQEIINDEEILMNLQDTNLAVMLSYDFVPNTALSYDKENKLLDFKISNVNEITKILSLFVKYDLVETNTGVTILDKNVTGKKMFDGDKIKLPTEDLMFDHKYNFKTKGEVYYSNHEINNKFQGNISLVDTKLNKYIGLNDNKVQIVESLNYANAYTIEGGSRNEDGDFIGAKLYNVRTEKYLSSEKGVVVESENNNASVDFVLQDDGSYIITLNGENVSFVEGSLVSESNNASNVQIYQIKQSEFSNEEELFIDPLSKPTVDVVNFQVYDGSIDFAYSFTDNDETLLSKNDVYDTKIRLKSAKDGTIVEEYNIEYLSKNSNIIKGLVSNTEYVLEIVGTYNLQDGSEDITEVFYKNKFKTKIILPTASNSKYQWIKDSCGIPKTTGVLTYEDLGNVAKNIKYVWYKKPSGNYNLSDLEQMKQLLEFNQGLKVKTYTFGVEDNPSDTSIDMKMFENGFTGRNYTAGDYLIAAYVETNLEDSYDVLVNVNSITIDGVGVNRADIAGISRGEDYATYRFTYNDPNNVFGCGTRNFESALYKVEDGKKTLVDGSNKQFTRDVDSGYIDLNYTNLTPNTNYEIEFIATSYNDLITIGPKKYSASFKTLNQFVTSSSTTMVVSNNSIEMQVNNLNHNSSIIDNIAINLYKWDSEADLNIGNDAKLIKSNQITVPSSFPSDLSTTFTLDQSGIYYGEVVVNYTKDDGGGVDVYSQKSIVRFVEVSQLRSKVVKEGQKLKIYDIDKSVKQINVYDENNTLINSKNNLSTAATVEIPANIKDITIVSINDDNVSNVEYFENSVNQPIYVIEGKNSVKLTSADYINDEGVIDIRVTKKQNIFEKFIGLFKDNETYETQTKLKTLNEQFKIPIKMQDIEKIEIKDKDNNSYQIVGGLYEE